MRIIEGVSGFGAFPGGVAALMATRQFRSNISPDNRWVVTTLVAAFGLIAGAGVTFMILKLIVGIIYPMIWQFGDFFGGCGALGIKGELIADPAGKISAIKLKFTNPEYARIFAETNGLVVSDGSGGSK